jgi:hypothetical protein
MRSPAPIEYKRHFGGGENKQRYHGKTRDLVPEYCPPQYAVDVLGRSPDSRVG